MRRPAAAVLVAACVAAQPSRADGTERERLGPPAATRSPTGRILEADDPHRRPGAALARPILRGPFADRRAPALLYLHGGGWVVTGKRALAENRPTIEHWASRGVAVWGADYRRDRMSLPDADAAYRELRRRVGRSRRVCVMGESSGGALAVLLAARYPRISCIVTYSAVGDFRLLEDGPLAREAREWLLPFGGSRRWDPRANAARVEQPVLLIHHVSDDVVPAAHSRSLKRRLLRGRLVLLPSASRGVKTTHGQLTSRSASNRAFASAVALVR